MHFEKSSQQTAHATFSGFHEDVVGNSLISLRIQLWLSYRRKRKMDHLDLDAKMEV